MFIVVYMSDIVNPLMHAGAGCGAIDSNLPALPIITREAYYHSTPKIGGIRK